MAVRRGPADIVLWEGGGEEGGRDWSAGGRRQMGIRAGVGALARAARGRPRPAPVPAAGGVPLLGLAQALRKVEADHAAPDPTDGESKLRDRLATQLTALVPGVTAADLAATVWKTNTTSQLDVTLLRALSHTGNFVVGAFDDRGSGRSDRLVGLSVGFVTLQPVLGLHSHMTGTAAELRPVREIDGQAIGPGQPGPLAGYRVSQRELR